MLRINRLRLALFLVWGLYLHKRIEPGSLMRQSDSPAIWVTEER